MSGLVISVRVMEYRFGLISQNMRVTGLTTKQMEKGSSITRTAMYTRVIGKTTRLMERESTLMPTARSIMVIGSTINNTGRVLSPGQMVLSTKANMSMARKKEMGHCILPMVLCSPEILREMKSTDVAPMNGLTGRNMRATGLTTRCADKAL